MVTWNVATSEPPDDITSLLQLNSPEKADLYVIGFVIWLLALTLVPLHKRAYRQVSHFLLKSWNLVHL